MARNRRVASPFLGLERFRALFLFTVKTANLKLRDVHLFTSYRGTHLNKTVALSREPDQHAQAY